MDWRKSTFSFANGNCVEVATLPLVAVRDTKDNGTGPVLTFAIDAWGKFAARVKESGVVTEEDAGLSCPELTREQWARVLGGPQDVPVTAFNSAV